MVNNPTERARESARARERERGRERERERERASPALGFVKAHLDEIGDRICVGALSLLNFY